MQERLKKFILYGALLCAALVVTALLYAPYLPRLASERYPQVDWPAPGDFATVGGGGEQVAPIPTNMTGSAFDRKGRRLFEEKDGKALLIFQGGRLRFEHYGQGYDSASRFNSYSMVKSLIGALVLRAKAEGKIRSLQDPVGSYLPDLGDATLRTVPVRDFLFMRSGIAFEPDGAKSMGGSKDIEATRVNPFSPMARLHMLGLDAVAGGLRTEPAARGRFSYQNVNTAVLGKLLTAVYDKPLAQILSDKIWAPSGAGTAYWRRYGPGREVTPYCCLYATPRDWGRVGLFLSRNGSKETCRFLPPALWNQYMGRELSDQSVRDGTYGPHVSHNVLDWAGEPLQGRFTYLMGSGGQTVYSMPDRDLVVVRFGGQVQLLHSTLYAAWRSIPHDPGVDAGAAIRSSRAGCN